MSSTKVLTPTDPGGLPTLLPRDPEETVMVSRGLYDVFDELLAVSPDWVKGWAAARYDRPPVTPTSVTLGRELAGTSRLAVRS